jgi:thioredoxin-dependent peroxiredoxin
VGSNPARGAETTTYNFNIFFPMEIATHKERKMPKERFGLIKLAGIDATVIGDDLKAGDKAPDFTVLKQDWSVVKGLRDSKRKVRIIAAMPSLDTSVCDKETRRFNEEASKLGKNIAVLVVSADLPYTQKRWCGAAGVDQVTTYSDSLKAEFGKKYGCLIKERRILRRAVFVVDRKRIIRYAAYMPTLGDEPNYEEVLAAARDALK